MAETAIEDAHRRLAFDLATEVEGEVRFDPKARHLYATDASHYRQVPIGVVAPRDADDVARAVAVCRHHGVPITGRGAGTSLAGQTANAAVVLDFSRHMDAIVELDPQRRVARVQPGVVLDDLRAAANVHDLTFGPDPSTHDRCTLGGMIGNNACGIHSLYAGKTVDNVRSLDVLLYDGTRLRVGATPEDELDEHCRRDGRVGQLYRNLRDLRDRYAEDIRTGFPDLPRRVSGFNLEQLLPEHGFHVGRALVGTEGTCALVLEAEVDLVPWPRARTLVALGYRSVEAAADDVPRVLEFEPMGLEGLDEHLTADLAAKGRTEAAAALPTGAGWLLVEFGGSDERESVARAERLVAALHGMDGRPDVRLYRDRAEAERVWRVRESGLGATAFVPGEPEKWTGWEDAAVPPDRLGHYLRGFRALIDRYGYRTNLYGHFGDGCVHCRISFDLRSTPGIAAYREFTREAAELVVRHGGSLSGEHGDGQARADLLGTMYGPELLTAFRRFKHAWDPAGGMNPGKVVDPFPRDSNLRLGADYAPWEPVTHFGWVEGDGTFSQETRRCVGVGTCRRDGDTGTMCPSWMVTHEEQHSTRGRARLLFEMLQPDSELDGWRDEGVAEALDLCLSCKGCKTDCPVGVDMATYKAEFLAHHWEGRRRPLSHYALGMIHRSVRLAARTPGLANLLLSAPVLATAVRSVAGVTTRRPAPRLAATSFRSWYRARGSRARAEAPEVLLFPDTFVDHLEPNVGMATVRVLEAAGYRVTLPPDVCCGRPLYDVGMLDRAAAHLRELVEILHPHVSAGGVVVGMEPSCLAVFRDELVNLLHDDPRARELAPRVLTLAEFLVDEADWTPPTLDREAIVHKHCHQEADLGYDAEAELYDRMGLRWRFTDAGCCGLAGSFGFEAGKYDVSVAVGERKLIPMVRGTEDGTLVMADGFSCRSQIAHLQERRRALHLAEVLAIALDGDPGGPASRAELAAPTPDVRRVTGRDAAAGASGILAALAAAGAAAALRRRRAGR